MTQPFGFKYAERVTIVRIDGKTYQATARRGTLEAIGDFAGDPIGAMGSATEKFESVMLEEVAKAEAATKRAQKRAAKTPTYDPLDGI